MTDEVLAQIGLDWEAARERIRAASPEFGAKELRLASVDSWDRKDDDVKDVIHEVARILDEKNLLWTVRVGKSIGHARPSGQLAEFLGESVMASLWAPPPP